MNADRANTHAESRGCRAHRPTLSRKVWWALFIQAPLNDETLELVSGALDVVAREPARGSTLLQLDAFICTRHDGTQTLEAQREIGATVVRAIGKFPEGEGKGAL